MVCEGLVEGLPSTGRIKENDQPQLLASVGLLCYHTASHNPGGKPFLNCVLLAPFWYDSIPG